MYVTVALVKGTLFCYGGERYGERCGERYVRMVQDGPIREWCWDGGGCGTAYGLYAEKHSIWACSGLAMSRGCGDGA